MGLGQIRVRGWDGLGQRMGWIRSEDGIRVRGWD